MTYTRREFGTLALAALPAAKPEGSDVMKELAKCVQYCKDALA